MYIYIRIYIFFKSGTLNTVENVFHFADCTSTEQPYLRI